MIFLAIILSLLLTLFNVYLVIRIWHFKEKMAIVNHNLLEYESSIKCQLKSTTQIIRQQQIKIIQIHQEYQILKSRWQKIRQFIILLSWLYKNTNKYFMKSSRF
ncbi:hypothetical protein Xen7305DRAFT_00013270 [Xenococcus sp. PCC 7305]|nr:hypothetical protein Xen7305DRAFT_00013270 [Xenococcus sp. PCC 7305]